MFIVSNDCALDAVRATMRETTPREDHGLIEELLEAMPEIVERFYLPAIAQTAYAVRGPKGNIRAIAYSAMAHELSTNMTIPNDPLLGGVAPNIKHFVGISDEILAGTLKAGWAAEHGMIALYNAANVIADNLLQDGPL